MNEDYILYTTELCQLVDQEGVYQTEVSIEDEVFDITVTKRSKYPVSPMQRIAELEEEVDGLEDDVSDKETEIDDLTFDLEQKDDELDEVKSELEDTESDKDSEIEDLQDRIDELEDELAELEAEVK